MSLAFIAVDPAAANAVSPIAAAARAAGASLTPRDGWHVAASLGDPAGEAAAVRDAVGVADVSHLAKLELLGELDHELSSATRHDAAWWCPVTPGRALLVGDPRDVALPDDVRVLDVTASFGALRIAGPAARETFARFCALDLREDRLPVGGFRPGSVARTPGFVLREADQRFLMLFGSAYGEYVWEVAIDAATRLGGRAVGIDAIGEEAARA
jgi:heterotetrameric sarcosine oxidase gamma subunit